MGSGRGTQLPLGENPVHRLCLAQDRACAASLVVMLRDKDCAHIHDHVPLPLNNELWLCTSH